MISCSKIVHTYILRESKTKESLSCSPGGSSKRFSESLGGERERGGERSCSGGVRDAYNSNSYVKKA